MVEHQRTATSDSTDLSHRICLSFAQSKQCAHGAIMCMLLAEHTTLTLVNKLKLMGGRDMLQLEDRTRSTVGGIPNTGSVGGNAVLLPERRPPARRHR